MTQEEKSLLLKDLCARLPYGVKCKWEHEYEGKTYTGGGILCDIDHVKTPNGYRYWDCYFEDEGEDIPIELVKPYLRPMSSMTEEEKYEIQGISGKDVEIFDDFINIIDSSRKRFSFLELQALLNWLNAHHFDYCGLIEKGLALEAPKDMYKF
jgi:hypothetical protein